MIIAFASGKGGTGKTVTAVNIGTILAENSKVLMIDLDQGQNVCTTIKNYMEPEKANLYFSHFFSLFDIHMSTKRRYEEIGIEDAEKKLMKRGIRKPSLFNFIIKTKNENLQVIYDPKELKIRNNSLDYLFDEIRKISSEYNYTILDCGAGYDDVVLNSLSIADKRILVEIPDNQAAKSAIKLSRDLLEKKLSAAFGEEFVRKMGKYSEPYSSLIDECERIRKGVLPLPIGIDGIELERCYKEAKEARESLDMCIIINEGSTGEMRDRNTEQGAYCEIRDALKKEGIKTHQPEQWWLPFDTKVRMLGAKKPYVEIHGKKELTKAFRKIAEHIQNYKK